MKTLLTALLSATLLITGCSSSSNSMNIVDKTFGQHKTFNGPNVTRTINVSGFNEIKTGQSITVNYVEAPTTLVTVTAPEDAMDNISVRTVGDCLECSIKGNCTFQRGQSVIVNVSAPGVSEFDASSSATINIASLRRYGMNIELDASSSATINAAAITCEQLSADASSSADININGADVNTLEADASSSADISIKGMTCVNAEIEASSSADVEAALAVSGKLEAEAKSSSTIKLSGTANWVDFSASSSGDIKAEELAAPSGNLKASSAGSIRSHVTNANVSKSSAGSVSNR